MITAKMRAPPFFLIEMASAVAYDKYTRHPSKRCGEGNIRCTPPYE